MTFSSIGSPFLYTTPKAAPAWQSGNANGSYAVKLERRATLVSGRRSGTRPSTRQKLVNLPSFA